MGAGFIYWHPDRLIIDGMFWFCVYVAFMLRILALADGFSA
jgi:hypothetical protein